MGDKCGYFYQKMSHFDNSIHKDMQDCRLRNYKMQELEYLYLDICMSLFLGR
jgi:hypothetical protein